MSQYVLRGGVNHAERLPQGIALHNVGSENRDPTGCRVRNTNIADVVRPRRAVVTSAEARLTADGLASTFRSMRINAFVLYRRDEKEYASRGTKIKTLPGTFGSPFSFAH